METELKFALSPEARGYVERHVLPLATGNAVGETDDTIYFDTSDRALKKAGFSLRIRHRLDDDSYVQTVKSAGNGNYHRQKWEWPVGAPRPDLGRLVEISGLPDVASGDSRLRALFRTEVRRTKLVVTPAAGAKIELSLDDGAIVAGNRSEPLSEVELELKAGPQEALFRLGLELLQVAPLALVTESKAERGYHLLDGTKPAARKPGAVPLAPDLSVRDGFRAFSAAVLDHLLSNQPAALRGEEQEGIHQMRVAIRRLRSLLVLFERFLEPHVSERFEEELRRLGQVLGVARDWDVFLADTLPRAVKDSSDPDWIEPLRARALERQHAAHQAAKKAVLEPAFARFVLAFEAWSRSGEGALPHRLLDRPLKQVAPDMLSRLARKVESRLADSDPDDADSLHSLRKSAKKLRYGIEYFESLYGKKAKAYYKRCNALQKRLGDLNDLATLTRLAAELTRDGRLDLAPALGILANRSEALAAKELKGLGKALRNFEREDPFWT
jgi:triphosphatase